MTHRAAERDEPLEVRERLRHGETTLDRRQVTAEEGMRQLVPVLRRPSQGGFGPDEPVLVVGDDLPSAA